MNVSNRQLNSWTTDLLDINPADRVLELGFGTRLSVRRIAAIATEALTDIFAQYAGQDVMKLVTEAGLCHVRLETNRVTRGMGGYVIADR